ncbi:thymidine kinase [Vulgatibacter sp.]|uniref:thymidine kinase n=1 Tax=Vulgatibacter sp. TaxID=1971226 RepID=UPI003567E014
MHHVPRDTGWIEVICGPMFSGKTEELIRRLKRAQIARQRVQVFKPGIDDRYAAGSIVSHSAQQLASQSISRAEQVLAMVHPETEVVGIDEVQFLEGDVVGVCETLADAGCRVVVAGLDQDYTGKPFEPMPVLLALAEYITKQLAICVRCGNPAGRSQRLVAEGTRVVVGAAESYEARCRSCHSQPVEQLSLPGTRRA